MEEASVETCGTPVLLVQELAGLGSPDVPARYVTRSAPPDDGDGHPRTTAAVAPAPVIDLARLRRQENGAGGEAGKLRQALESWGLFLVANHGVEASLMDGVMDAAREFFRQPVEEKRRYTNLVDGERFQLQGYGNDRVRSEEQLLDWCDRLYLKVEPQEQRSLELWPKRPKHFRDILHEYTIKCREVKGSLLVAMADILGVNEDYFVNQFGDDADTHARFTYYPKCPKPELVYGLKPHSDATVLTILMVDNNVGGLQVLRDGVWYDAPASPHTLLVNVGDMAEIMSNGIFKSPVHRVVTNTEKERLSVALFYTVDPERVIEPAAELVNEERPALYKKVKTKDYTAGLYEDFSMGKRVIDRVKVHFF